MYRTKRITQKSVEKHIVYKPDKSGDEQEEIQETKVREFNQLVEEEGKTSFIEAVSEHCPQLAGKLIDLVLRINKPL